MYAAMMLGAAEAGNEWRRTQRWPAVSSDFEAAKLNVIWATISSLEILHVAGAVNHVQQPRIMAMKVSMVHGNEPYWEETDGQDQSNSSRF